MYGKENYKPSEEEEYTNQMYDIDYIQARDTINALKRELIEDDLGGHISTPISSGSLTQVGDTSVPVPSISTAGVSNTVAGGKMDGERFVGPNILKPNDGQILNFNYNPELKLTEADGKWSATGQPLKPSQRNICNGNVYIENDYREIHKMANERMSEDENPSESPVRKYFNEKRALFEKQEEQIKNEDLNFELDEEYKREGEENEDDESDIDEETDEDDDDLNHSVVQSISEYFNSERSPGDVYTIPEEAEEDLISPCGNVSKTFTKIGNGKKNFSHNPTLDNQCLELNSDTASSLQRWRGNEYLQNQKHLIEV